MQPVDLSSLVGSREVPLLLQWDERWGYQWYAGQYLALSGCGPTCLSMAYVYLTGDPSFLPREAAEFATAHGFASDGNGSEWSLIPEGGSLLGLDVTELPLDEGRVRANLEAGNPVICVMGPGDFTTTGHFVVLAGMDGDSIVVRDPNSRSRPKMLWSYERLAGQVQALWALRNA